MKIFIVVDACSGEDYSCDDPTVLLVTDDYEKAENFFNDEVDNWEDGMTDFESNVETDFASCKMVYECTDFEGDSHRILKLVIKEVE